MARVRGLPRGRGWLLAIGCGLLLVIACVNGLIRWISAGGPFWLDPRHLPSKVEALASYAQHRAGCALFDDDGAVVPGAHRAAQQVGVDPELFEALVQVESGGHAHRISPTGAMGPAQLTASTARELGVEDPFSPPEALLGGARYLREQLVRFHNDRALALAAYNAGPNAVQGAVPHNGETEIYVPRVLALYERLHAERHPPAPPPIPTVRRAPPARAAPTPPPAPPNRRKRPSRRSS